MRNIQAYFRNVDTSLIHLFVSSLAAFLNTSNQDVRHENEQNQGTHDRTMINFTHSSTLFTV